MDEQLIKEAVAEIVNLALSGNGAEAWNRFYHPEVEKTDLDGKSILGFENVLKANHSLLESITEVRIYSHVGSLVQGNRSFIVWDVDFDIAGQGAVKATEVCIQDWQDGKIIRERFFA